MSNGKKSKKKVVIGSVIIVLIMAFVYFGSTFGKVNADEEVLYVKTKEVIQDDIKAFVSTTGVVISKETFDVYSKLNGELVKLNIKEGDKVSKDQIIAELDTNDITSQIRDTKLQLEISKETLKSIVNQSSYNYKGSYKNALLNKESALKTYEDTKKLYEAGVSSKSELDQANSAYVQAKNTYGETRSKYNGESSTSDIKIQELRVEALENSLNDYEIQLEKAIFKSPIDGVITALNVKQFDFVSTGTVLFTVEDLDKLKVEANISQYDINKISLDQFATITAKGIDGVEFEGKVSHIGSRAVGKASGQSQDMVVEIEADIISKDTNLKPNYSAKLKIEVASEENVLLIPYETVYVTKEKEKVVFTIENGLAKKHIIKRGVEGVFNFQVISDTIKLGDLLILNPTESLNDGDAVIDLGGSND